VDNSAQAVNQLVPICSPALPALAAVQPVRKAKRQQEGLQPNLTNSTFPSSQLKLYAKENFHE